MGVFHFVALGITLRVATFQDSLNGRPQLRYCYAESGSCRRHPYTSLMQYPKKRHFEMHPRKIAVFS